MRKNPFFIRQYAHVKLDKIEREVLIALLVIFQFQQKEILD